MEILQLFFSPFGAQPRPSRFLDILQKTGTVTVCCAPSLKKQEEQYNFLPLTSPKNTFVVKAKRAPFLFLRQYEKDIWTEQLKYVLKKLEKKQFQLIVCQDIMALPLAVAIKNLPQNKNTCRLIMDAREFYPRQFENRLMWRLAYAGLNNYICKEYLPQTDVVFTVSPGLAQGFLENYKVPCQLLPSLSYYHDLTPHPTWLNKPLRCIHHGNAASGRKLENMIDAFKLLQGKATLDFMLVPTDAHYMEFLQKKAQDCPHINFIPPVPMPEIVSFISQYDLGVYLLSPVSFNHRHAWPNKLFEFIQARLGLIVSPVPDMAGLVQERHVGVVTEDFTPESLTRAIKALTPEIVDGFKQKSHEAAKDLCWENNEARILEVVKNL